MHSFILFFFSRFPLVSCSRFYLYFRLHISSVRLSLHSFHLSLSFAPLSRSILPSFLCAPSHLIALLLFFCLSIISCSVLSVIPLFPPFDHSLFPSFNIFLLPSFLPPFRTSLSFSTTSLIISVVPCHCFQRLSLPFINFLRLSLICFPLLRFFNYPVSYFFLYILPPFPLCSVCLF